MNETGTSHGLIVFAEILSVDQLARASVGRLLPKGMELSHLLVLNHLMRGERERSPAELAKALHLTRGAMSNTMQKLEWAGWVHVRPDWDDARRKMVAISPSGKSACVAALQAIEPIFETVIADLGDEKIRAAISVLRELRKRLAEAR